MLRMSAVGRTRPLEAERCPAAHIHQCRCAAVVRRRLRHPDGTDSGVGPLHLSVQTPLAFYQTYVASRTPLLVCRRQL